MKQLLLCSQEEFILSDVASPPLSRFQCAGVFTLHRGVGGGENGQPVFCII